MDTNNLQQMDKAQQIALQYKLSGNDETKFLASAFLDLLAEADKMVVKIVGMEATTAAATLGSMTSERKAASSRENGRKGGRPKMDTPEFYSSTFSMSRDSYSSEREYYATYQAACKHYGYKARVEGGWKFWEFENDYETWKNQR